MSRPLRLEYAGALYHVTARGNERKPIYLEDDDFQLYLDVLGDVCNQYHWVIHAYCLMTNHYHLIIETPDANLSKGMRQLNGVYTQKFNRKYRRVGHLYQGRYKAILVEKDNYLLELSRYVVLNPVRAKMVSIAGDWQWSSYNQTIGVCQGCDWLAVDPMLLQFSRNRSLAIKRFEEFVANGVRQTVWDKVSHQVFLGSELFIEQHEVYKEDLEGDLSEIPVKQRRRPAKSLEGYIAESKTRNMAMYAAYSSGSYTLKDIAQYFKVHYSTVSRVIAKCKT